MCSYRARPWRKANCKMVKFLCQRKSVWLYNNMSIRKICCFISLSKTQCWLLKNLKVEYVSKGHWRGKKCHELTQNWCVPNVWTMGLVGMIDRKETMVMQFYQYTSQKEQNSTKEKVKFCLQLGSWGKNTSIIYI